MNAREPLQNPPFTDPDEAPELTEEWFRTAALKEGDEASEFRGEGGVLRALLRAPKELADVDFSRDREPPRKVAGIDED
jgi:hypothetical protein